jgi:hypothetical protein
MEASPEMITPRGFDESMEAAGRRIIARMDESLERMQNKIVLEIRLFRDESDSRFGGIEARLDQQAELLQSLAHTFLRFENRP